MENKNIAYLGPKATFTHEASLKYFAENNNFIALNRIDEVFRKVIKGEADYGVVPAENSIGGTIVDTLDLFIQTDLKVFDQITLEITQNLLSTTTKDKIKKVYTHPQSFMQCSKYLFDNFKNIEYVETTSNAKAAMLAADDNMGASIGPRLCSSVYGLQILEEGINDFKHNETKFFIIAKELQQILKSRSMIIFSLPDRPGSLFDILKIFKWCKINMTRIESRPSKIKKWHYVFIIEFENSLNLKKHEKLIKNLQKKCIYFDYLGSY